MLQTFFPTYCLDNHTYEKMGNLISQFYKSYLNFLSSTRKVLAGGKIHIDGRKFYQILSSFDTYRNATYVKNVAKDCPQNACSQSWYNLSQESQHLLLLNLTQQE